MSHTSLTIIDGSPVRRATENTRKSIMSKTLEPMGSPPSSRTEGSKEFIDSSPFGGRISDTPNSVVMGGKSSSKLSSLRSRVTSSQQTSQEPKSDDSAATRDITAISNTLSKTNLNNATMSENSANGQGAAPVTFMSEDIASLDTKSLNVSKIRTDEMKMGMIKGRSAGPPQKEPDWTPAQLEAIRKATSVEVAVGRPQQTRTSQPDPDQMYVGVDEEGNPCVLEAGFLSKLTPEQYMIGVGEGRFDNTGDKPRIYSDIVLVDAHAQWLQSQITSAGVVIQGMTKEQLDQPVKAGKRRMGYDFARIGLPKFSFGPLFNTLEKKYPKSTSKFKVSKGYYWTNASWGVGKTKGVFIYRDDEDAGMSRESDLSVMLRRLQGRSSLCDCLVALALVQGSMNSNGEQVPSNDGYEISVKIHSLVHFSDVEIYGPPLPTSTSIGMSDKYVSRAKPLPKATIAMSTISSKPAGAFKPIPGQGTTPSMVSDSGQFMA